MLIADENIPVEIIEGLRKAALDTFSIYDSKRGISDKEIIEFAQNPPRIILTEDKDFGDLVFAYNHKKVSVILLRYHYSKLKHIETILIDFLKKNVIEQHSFIVITPNNIRLRKI